MSNERAELLAKADELGLTYPKNISTLKLEENIIAALDAEVNPPVDEDSFKSTDIKLEKEDPEVPSRLSTLDTLRNAILAAKKRAFATQVVTLTNRDNRENDFMTTAYLGFENQHFNLSKLVPLDVPVELEQALIDVAESTMITLHKDQIVDGKRTGNKIATPVKKFSVSYAKQSV